MIGRSLVVFLLSALVACSAIAQPRSRVSVEIDLQEQLAYLIEDGDVVLASPISSGRERYETTRGVFKITEKNRNHFSSLYGKIVDAYGNTVVADADADMPVPRGGRFVPAPMRYFMRYNGAEGMHAGILPGYPASHGCVRLPEENAIAFFNAVEVGTPVTVFGRTVYRRREIGRDYYGTPRRDRAPQGWRGGEPFMQERVYNAPAVRSWR